MATNVFDKTIPDLQEWGAGQPVSARKLNQQVRAINTMVRGVAPPSQVPIRAGGGLTTTGTRALVPPLARKFKLEPGGAEHFDVVECRVWDEETDQLGRRLWVHKPWLLRRMPFDSFEFFNAPAYDGSMFEYSSHTQRLRRPLDELLLPRVQWIRPRYVDDDVILAVPTAVKTGRRTGVTVTVSSDDEVAVGWLSGEGDPLPDLRDFDSQYAPSGLVFPEMIVHTETGRWGAQLFRATEERGRVNVLSIDAGHGLVVGDRITLEWSHEFVETGDARTWQLKAANVLIWSDAAGHWFSDGRFLEDYVDLLAQYDDQNAHTKDSFTGNIHDYSLIFYANDNGPNLAEEEWAADILNGAWSGRVVLSGSANRGSDADQVNNSVNALSDKHGMVVLGADGANSDFSGDVYPVEVHALTRNIGREEGEGIKSWATRAVSGGTTLSTATGFPGTAEAKPWLAENTVNRVSWVVSGTGEFLQGNRPEPGVPERNYQFMLNLFEVPVIGS